MSDLVSSGFKVPDLGEEPPQESVSTSTLQFCLHSCYYRDFFLLRTRITINGRPAVIKEGEGEQSTYLYDDETGVKLKLSDFSSLAAKKLVPYGVYHIDTFYYDQVPLLSVVFQSKTRLKQFLLSIKDLRTELEKTVGEALTKSVSNNGSHVDVEIQPKLFLASPSVTDTKTKAKEVTLANYCYCAKSWQESKVFDFSQSLFDGEPTQDCSQSDQEEAELADLQRELKPVVEWFNLGVQLEIPEADLLAIRKDNHFQTEDCRREMLIKWGQLETRTWSKLITALINIDRKVLAKKLANKYGILMPISVSDTFAQDPECNKIDGGDQKQLRVVSNDEEAISNLEIELEKATESRDAVSKALEMNIENSLPDVQVKLYSLSEDIRQLKIKLRNREEENQMLEIAKQKLNKRWTDVIERTRRERGEKINTLSKELGKKEEELAQTKELLTIKEKELQEKMEELKSKSALVIQLQNKLDDMRQKFITQQEETDQKLIESKALAQSHENYCEEIKVKLNNASKEICRRRQEAEHASKEMASKEIEISQLSERIDEQETEIAKLREDLDSHHRSPEQLSSEQMNEDDEKAIQLLTLIINTNQMKLQLHKAESEKDRQSSELDRTQRDLQKYKAMIPDITKCYAEGPGLHGAEKHKPSQFQVHVLNEDGTYCTGSHHIDVEIMSSPHDNSNPGCRPVRLNAQLTKDEKNSGVYTVTYTPSTAGPYSIAVKVNDSYLDTNPYSVTVLNNPDSRKCYTVGLQDTAEKLSPSNFQVHLVDEDGEHCWGEHEVSIQLTNPQGDQVTTSITPTDKPGVYEASFTPTKSGHHDIMVKVNDAPVKNAPFRSCITCQQPDISKCYAEGPGLHGAEKHKPSQFQVHVLDEDGNHCTGSHKIGVEISDSFPFDVKVTKDNTSYEYGVYTCSYVPTKAGLYDAAIKINDTYLDTHRIFVVNYPDPVKCYTIGLQDTAEKLSPTNFQVHLVDEDGDHCWGEHEVSVEIGIPNRAQAQTLQTASVAKSEGELCGVYDVSFTPTTFGPHYLYIMVSIRDNIYIFDDRGNVRPRSTSTPFILHVRNPQTLLSEAVIPQEICWKRCNKLLDANVEQLQCVVAGNDKIYCVTSHDTFESHGSLQVLAMRTLRLNTILVHVYCPATDNWNKLPEYKHQLANFGVTEHNSHLVLVGVSEKQSHVPSNDLVVWDDQQQAWTHPYPRPPVGCISKSPLVASYKNWIVVVEGDSETLSLITRIELLNTSTNQWYKTAPVWLPFRLQRSSATIIGNMWYIAHHDHLYAMCIDDLIDVATCSTSFDLASLLERGTLFTEKCNLPALMIRGSSWLSTTVCTLSAFNGTLLCKCGRYNNLFSFERLQEAKYYVYRNSSNEWIEVDCFQQVPNVHWKNEALTTLPDNSIFIASVSDRNSYGIQARIVTVKKFN